MEMQDNSVLHVDIGQDSFPRRAKVRPKRSRDSSKSHALTGRDGRVSRHQHPDVGPTPRFPALNSFKLLSTPSPFQRIHPCPPPTTPSSTPAYATYPRQRGE